MALRTEEHPYVEYKTGERELCDLKEDPYEPRNLYATASPDLKRRPEGRLDTLWQCSAEGCRSAEEG